MLKKVLIVIMVGAAAATAATATPAPAQEAQSVLPALLAEVRALRSAIEDMASAAARAQLALGRLQIQEQRVDRLLRRLDTVRSALSGAERTVLEGRQALTRLESHAQTTGADQRLELERERAALKLALAQSLAEVQRLEAEEADLQAQIGTEQQRWTDINRHMEEMERGLRR